MSTVTASIIVGTRQRRSPGLQPRWMVLLHEGTNYAWHLVRLHLTAADVANPTALDDPPGVLWRAAPDGDLIGELGLMLHLYAAKTAELVEATRACAPLRRRRVDLAALEGRHQGDFHNAVRIAHRTGRELFLSVTILPGSRLTEEALLAMPDWEMEISYPALSRDWNRLEGGGLVVTDHRLATDEDAAAEPEGRAEDSAPPQAVFPAAARSSVRDLFGP